MKMPPPVTEYLVMYQYPNDAEPYCPYQFSSYCEAQEYIEKRMTQDKKFKTAEIEIVARTTTYEVM